MFDFDKNEKHQRELYLEGHRDGLDERESAAQLVIVMEGYLEANAYSIGYMRGLKEIKNHQKKEK